MRRWFWLPVLVLVILAGVAIGVGAYHAGYDHGLEANGSQVVRVIDRGGGFGFFLFPLFFFLLVFFLIRAAFWGRRWGGPGHWGPGHPDHGDWKGGRAARLEELHRRLHQQDEGDHPGSGGEPASV
jgi:hypothetical protein